MSKISSAEIKYLIAKNLNKDFFKRNIPDERSAYAILDFSVQVDAEGKIADLAKGYMRQDIQEEIEREGRVIDAESDIDKLYNMLRKPFSTANTYKLIEKLMTDEDKIMPKLIKDIQKSGNDSFVEAAARLLVKYPGNYSGELAEILMNIKYPYTQAVMSYVLGKVGDEEHIEAIYNSFAVLKRDYINEPYFEGPLLGLHEMRRRYEF